MLDKVKLRLSWWAFIILTILISVFLYRWQVLDYSYYSGLASDRTKVEQSVGNRGKILSSDRSVLAYTTPAYDIFVYKVELNTAEKNKAQTRDEFATKMATVLGLDKTKLLSDIETNPSNYFKIAEKIDLDTKNAVLALNKDKSGKKLEGYIVETTEKRVYPNNEFASHVIGYMGKDIDGNDKANNGVEGYYDGEMKPQKGQSTVEKDSYGNVILGGQFEQYASKNGRDIVLTIDRGLQKVLQQKLDEGRDKYSAVYTSGIIMDPKTGNILAMALSPEYDPNKYFQSDISVLNNRNVSDPYEPGSVVKALTASAGIDSGSVTPDEQLFASHKGCIEISDPKDNGKKWNICVASKVPSPGPKDLVKTLQTSDNIGAYMVAKKTGIEKMDSYFRKFGVGKPTGVGLAEETSSSLKSAANWNEIDLATYSFGQGMSMTPLQVVSAFSTIANGGKRMKPQIVSSVIDGTDEIPIQPKLEEQVISENSASIVRDMLVKTFKYNIGATPYKKETANYLIAGKSGTAQIPKTDGPGYDSSSVNATYVGFDANPDPKFVMIIKINKPKDAAFSTQNAFPLWVSTFLEIKDLLGVQKVQ
ncbi:MAG: penicillin-binding protein 2 [bacterium]